MSSLKQCSDCYNDCYNAIISELKIPSHYHKFDHFLELTGRISRG